MVKFTPSLLGGAIYILCLFHSTEAWFTGRISSTNAPSLCDVTNHTYKCSRAGLVAIPEDVPQSTEDMFLPENNITVIPKLKLFELRILNLADNRISQIRPDVFEFLNKLRELNLAGNVIHTLERNCFNGLDELRELNLDANLIKFVPSDTLYPRFWSKLETLDLSDNLIETLDPNALTDLRTLRSLDMTNNRIRHLDRRHFAGLYDLRHLGLNRNRLTNISEHTFVECQRLNVLDLSYNHIRDINAEAFVGLVQLDTLSLTDNQLEWVPNATFPHLEKLENLHLDYNLFREFDTNIFPPNVRKITMDNMDHLVAIRNGAFTGLLELEYIRISGSLELHTIETGAFDGTNSSLKDVDFSANSLQTLSEDLLNWSRIHNVDLSSNPWQCDCKLEWMKEVYMKDNDRRRIKCHSPSRLAMKSVADIRYTEFVCTASFRHNAGIGLVILVTLVFAAVSGVLIFRYRDAIFPVLRGKQGQYKAMYDPVHTDESAININYRAMDSKQWPLKEVLPTAV